MKKKELKRIILVFSCLFCLTSCCNEKNEIVKKVVEIRKEEKEEKAKIEKEEKIVELEKVFFENVTLNFEKATKEKQEYITIYNEDCDIKSYYNKGFSYDYVGRIVDDKKTQDKLLEIAKKNGFELYDAEQDHTGLVSQPREMNYKGNFAIYKNYIFVNIKK